VYTLLNNPGAVNNLTDILQKLLLETHYDPKQLTRQLSP